MVKHFKNRNRRELPQLVKIFYAEKNAEKNKCVDQAKDEQDQGICSHHFYLILYYRWYPGKLWHAKKNRSYLHWKERHKLYPTEDEYAYIEKNHKDSNQNTNPLIINEYRKAAGQKISTQRSIVNWAQWHMPIIPAA